MTGRGHGARTRPELVIGLVTPVGTDTGRIARNLRGDLARWNYDGRIIHLSDRLKSPAPQDEQDDDRILRLIKAGNSYRSASFPNDGLGPLVVESIQNERLNVNRKHYSNEYSDDALRQIPASSVAYIIHSLKRPSEVTFLRERYGSLFFLLGCKPSTEARIESLAIKLERRTNWSDEQRRQRALELISIDDNEPASLPAVATSVDETLQEAQMSRQDVRKTFTQSDIFLPETGLTHRAVDLLFSNHTIAPTLNEYAMFMAESSSSRSLSASRRVGAAVVVDESIVSTGWNEVPEVSGEEPDSERGVDTSENLKRQLALSTIQQLKDSGWINPDKFSLFAISDEQTEPDIDPLLKELMPVLEGSELTNVIEFQRPVHAEMWALLDAAKRGVPLEGASIYCNTFPCHLCWKHIFAVGIKKMYYIDSYPKSRATSMYKKTSSMLEPFTGVAPRRYSDLFMNEQLEDRDLHGHKWTLEHQTAFPLYDFRDAVAYIGAELDLARGLPEEETDDQPSA